MSGIQNEPTLTNMDCDNESYDNSNHGIFCITGKVLDCIDIDDGIGKMIKLTKEQILMLHAQLIEGTGGCNGIRDEGFNPFVWYALKEIPNDREVACDTSMLNLLGEADYEDISAPLQ